jgi:hypothetical protein
VDNSLAQIVDNFVPLAHPSLHSGERFVDNLPLLGLTGAADAAYNVWRRQLSKPSP